MTRTLMTTALVTALTAGTLSADTTMVSEIDVDVDLDAVQNFEAAKAWGNLEQDLEAAITSRLVDRIDDEGLRILIDIDEIALASSFESAIGIAESSLSGMVRFKKDINAADPGTNIDAYELIVTAEQVTAYYPDDLAVKPVSVDSDVYYAAVVNVFADNVVKNFVE